VSGTSVGYLEGNQTCTVDASVASDASYNAATDSQSFTIADASLTVQGSSATITYGQSPPTFTPSYSGWVLGDSPSSLSSPAVCAPPPPAVDAGTYPINCSGAVDSNYNFSYIPGTLIINPAPLTITAPHVTRIYGIPNVLVPVYTGLENGDAAPATPPTCTSRATTTSSPGAYPVTCGGAVDPNYIFTYVQQGQLIVVKAPTSFTITETITKTGKNYTGVYTESGLAPGTKGFVPFETGSGIACAIELTGKPGPNSCTASFGTNLPYVITGDFIDGDGNYLDSDSTNQLHPHD
jgi:hypothetical protein